MKVTLVMDTLSGEALAAFDKPLWVCDSPVNRPVAERLWSAPNIDPMAVTTFKMSSESLDESGADIIPTIDEHHPQWTEVVVAGAPLTPSPRATFEDYGPGHFVEGDIGFTFVRRVRVHAYRTAGAEDHPSARRTATASRREMPSMR